MVEYDPVLYSRLLTGLTLGFHVIFATLGVGIPLMIALAHWLGIRRNDDHYILMARRWAKGFIVIVAVGVVTGTAIALQLSLLWPNFMRVAGHTIGLPMFMEVFAFFFEAIFLGLYLYTWDRFKSRYTHFLLLIPVVIGSTASAFFISTVNAFMNAPYGFSMVEGVLTDVNPLAAMFNPATATKISHVIISSYLTSAFVLAAIAAFHLLKGRTSVYHKKALHLTMTAGVIFAIGTILIGDFSGKYLHYYQPEKLAAAEWHFETESEAPLIVGGILNSDGEVKYAIEIPYALSILAGGTIDTEVKGLNEFPTENLPPLWIHYLFDGMVFIGMFLAAVSLLYLLAQRMKWTAFKKPLLMAILAGGPLALLAVESGWIFSEVGRQPWIIYGVMTTEEAATVSQHVDLMLVLFLILYIVLGFTCIRVLRGMFQHDDIEQILKQRK
ncbi:cytochrome ubiquinol oxidase subunit I [Bacillus lacus]|uniref:Cytochrome ubiquinol oxidase subunit I n=1 Tax=Metabacillus lacus TaxID=1983721 RepID=A0A7X2J1A2_9BACI|nr:cytochrome ubiquinol oxidase subunit I [Metabacillus lacus]MRX73439.1 cytochrome ubiquinol oxidase subunit I [Metabacillus lacus]